MQGKKEDAAMKLRNWFFGYIDNIPLNNLQKRMLNAFPGYISRDGNIASTFTYFICLVDVHNALLTLFQILPSLMI